MICLNILLVMRMQHSVKPINKAHITEQKVQLVNVNLVHGDWHQDNK